MLTQERLKQLLNYDPETGVFTRMTRTANSVKIGEEAGAIHQYTHNLIYREIGIDRATYKAHRLAFLYMTGEMPSDKVDHIDGNGLNNAWANLRSVSNLENCRNQKRFINNKSGHPGVSWYARDGVWRAAIGTGGAKKHLGYFANLDDAIAAKKQAEIALGYHENHGRQAA